MLNDLKPLIDKSLKRSFGSGSIILYQSEIPRSAYVLTNGMVKAYSISTQGDDQIVMFHVPGEFFPSPWIFGKTSSSLFFYEALEDCEVAVLPKSDLINFMTSTKPLTSSLLNYFITSQAASHIRVNALEQPKARDKLTYTLYYLCQLYGTTAKDRHNFVIPINLTHQSLASLVGLTRETTAMEMSKMKKQGIISYKKQRYSVNLDRLLEVIGEESFKGVSIAD